MKLPWQNLTGLAKIAAILAIVLGIATGLCGLNVLVDKNASSFGIFTGILELCAMIACTLGLIVIGLIAAIDSIFRPKKNTEDPQ